MRPRYAIGSAWPQLQHYELRIFMARLLDLEQTSPLGPVRARFRARRAEAVRVYRRIHGSLGDDALWVAPDAGRGTRLARPHGVKLPVAQIHGWRLFWLDAL